MPLEVQLCDAKQGLTDPEAPRAVGPSHVPDGAHGQATYRADDALLAQSSAQRARAQRRLVPRKG